MQLQQAINRKRTNKIYAFAHSAHNATTRLRPATPRNQFADAAFIG